MNAKKLIGTALSVVLCASMLAGCGNQKNETETTTEKGKKTLVIGDTTFNSSNEENNVNPHDAYSGWACIRYGIGETLVKYSDTMEIEPWLAKEWENVDELTWKITLQDNVKFSSGRDMDAEAVEDGAFRGAEIPAEEGGSGPFRTVPGLSNPVGRRPEFAACRRRGRYENMEHGFFPECCRIYLFPAPACRGHFLQKNVWGIRPVL